MRGSLAASGQFGSRLTDEDPERYARIVQTLGEFNPMARIAREQKVNPATVAVIMKRERNLVDKVQQLTGGLITYAAQQTLLKIVQKLESDEIPAACLGVLAGIPLDKERASLGLATHVIEHKRTITIEDVRKELEEMKRGAVEAEIVEG